MARLSRGANDFKNPFLDQLLDQICEQVNRLQNLVSQRSDSNAAQAVSLYNNGASTFTPGMLGGYSSSGIVTPAIASSTPILARFVATGNAPSQTAIPAVLAGAALPVFSVTAPSRRGQPAWLSQTRAGYVTPTLPASGWRQFVGVYDLKDPETGLWNLVFMPDPQGVKGL